jgi:tetratricopeptide (TPR) repeat protein
LGKIFLNKIENSFLFVLLFVVLSAKGQMDITKADSFYFKGDWEKAIQLYKMVLGDTSTNALLWQRLAFSNQQMGNYKDALEYYKKTFSLNPSVQLKFYMYPNILETYNKLSLAKEALQFLKTETNKGYNNFVLIESLPMFDSFKKTTDYNEVIDKAKMNAYPCLSNPHSHDMDFWVGEWDVYSKEANSTIGKSSITKEDGGCVIIEHFESLVSPQSGHSINFYDQKNSSWTQLYAGSDGGNQLYTNGIYKNSAMIFDYKTTLNEKTAIGHYILYNQGPNQFRQYQDISFDEGKTFSVNYDLIYKRKE